MNLGMLMAWEQVYRLKVKENSVFESEEDMRSYLKNEKQLDETAIQIAYQFYDFAIANFTNEQWKKAEDLFKTLEEGRGADFNKMMTSIATVLWEMGVLFGTNFPDRQAMN